MTLPKGRMTIRRTGPNPAEPFAPPNGRENRRVRLWEFEVKPGTPLAKLEVVYLAALDAVDKIAEHKLSAIKSGKFSDDGVKDDVQQFALNNLVPTFKRGRREIAVAKKEAAELRAKIGGIKKPETDAESVSLRREIRDRLTAMPPKDRDIFLDQNIERLEPIVAEAILTAPGWLSGVSAGHRTLLNDKALEAQHGEAVADLKELERAIEVAESAVETGRDEVRLELGIFDRHEFDRLAEPIEAKVAAPWLKKFNESGRDVVRVVIPGKAHTPQIATPEEIATGIFADNLDQYREQAA